MPLDVALPAQRVGDELAFQWAVRIQQEDGAKQWSTEEVLQHVEAHGTVSFNLEPLDPTHTQESGLNSFENQHTLTRRFSLTHPLAAVEVLWQLQQQQQQPSWAAGRWVTMQGDVRLLPLVRDMQVTGSRTLPACIRSNEGWLVSGAPALEIRVCGATTNQVSVTLLPLIDDCPPHPLLTPQPQQQAASTPLVINRTR